MPAGELAVRGITPSLLVCGMVIPIPNPVTMHLPGNNHGSYSWFHENDSFSVLIFVTQEAEGTVFRKHAV